MMLKHGISALYELTDESNFYVQSCFSEVSYFEVERKMQSGYDTAVRALKKYLQRRKLIKTEGPSAKKQPTGPGIPP